jgi:REP element-mobilizing transposase RayT/uncharacterized protein YoaH (UPF0181 family)
MPRHPRLDIPGLLHHVIIRGIEKCLIVRDETDRLGFVSRLGQLSEECRTPVYAWALLDNHAHLLVRSSDYGLPRFMRRLLTGHAVTFNLRHKRHGHLFQNRYKSIVCDEDSYFLELVRYIHLNPLRAGLVQDLETLKNYPWCGHTSLMGHQQNHWQGREQVLRYFGDKEKPAVARYEQFVADGLTQGKRPELVGGGLRRSQVKERQEETQLEAFDERILGAGEFVAQILEQTEMDVSPISRQDKQQRGAESLKRICSRYSVSPQELGSGSRRQAVSAARALLVKELVCNCGWTAAATARPLGVSTSAVSKILARERVGSEKGIPPL